MTGLPFGDAGHAGYFSFEWASQAKLIDFRKALPQDEPRTIILRIFPVDRYFFGEYSSPAQ